MAGRLPAPRWQTDLPADVVGSWGPEAAAWGERVLGIRLDRAQRRILNRALAVRRDGRLAHRLYLASMGRQNGKTTIVRVLVGWALTARNTPPWRLILGLAHDRTQARIPYEAVLSDLTPLASSTLRLTRYLGIRSRVAGRSREYLTASREARNAIRSYSVDLGVFDEIRTQQNFDTWAALEPTTTARPDPLIFAISTAGNDRSILLRAWWEQGVRIIDGAEPFRGFGMTWYAAPEGAPEDSTRALRAANPALAEGRLPLSAFIGTGTIRPGTPEWRQERLNLWSDAADEWLPPGVWARQGTDQPADWGRTVLGVEVVPTWRRATVTVSIVTDAGAWTGIAGEIDASRTDRAAVSPDDLVRLLRDLAPAWEPDLVTWSAAAAAAPHVESWAGEAGIPGHGLNGREIRSASQLFRSELMGGKAWHAPDELLALQARQARPSGPVEGGEWYFSIVDSPGEIDAVRAAAWSAWGAISPEARRAGVQIHV